MIRNDFVGRIGRINDQRAIEAERLPAIRLGVR
jgi:hypothetical protein